MEIKCHSMATPSRGIDDPKRKNITAAQYTTKHLRRTWRKARLMQKMCKGAA